MAEHGQGKTGKWLAGGLVIIGLVAAIVGWKFRKLSPRPAPPTPDAPTTTTLAEPP